MNKKLISLALCLLMLVNVISVSVLSVSAGSEPVISVVYADTAVFRGDFCEVILKVDCDEEVTYQWEAGFIDGHLGMTDLPENDVYKGVNTNHFKLKAEGSLWQLDFRCKVTYSGGTVYSQRFIFMFLDPLPIETAEVTGIDKPKFGYTPDYETDDTDSDKYENGKVEWYGPNDDGESFVKMNNTDAFAQGTYKCRIYLDPVEGYTFNEDSRFRIDGLNCMVTKEQREDGEDTFYAERYYDVAFNGTIPEVLLDFEERTPYTEETQDYYLGSCYLGTDSMNMNFSFKPKALPLNLLKRGYYVLENTRIANVKNESLYNVNEGASVNFADYAKEKGKYAVYHTICLMSPEDEKMAEKEVSYVIDVYEPKIVTSAGITFNAFPTWTKTFYTYVARTPETEFNTMFWYDVTEGKTQINGDADFVSGHTYRMEVHIKTVDGYVFAVDADGCPDITATINGMTAEVISAASNETATIAFEFTYEAKELPTYPVESSTATTSTDSTEPTSSVATTVPAESSATDPSETMTTSVIPDTTPTESKATIPANTENTDNSTLPSESVTTKPTETVTTPSESVTIKPSDSVTTPSDNTNNTATSPSEPQVDKGILGDVNGDGKVNVKDATMIQKAAAKIITLTDAENLRANVNGDNKVNVKDATAIQKSAAKIETGFPIGEKIK